MKKISLLLILAITIISFPSCDKENSLSGRYRIIKMDFNPQMTNPIVFGYNKDGLLSRVLDEEETYEIDYNQKQLPIKVTRFWDGELSRVIEIDWTTSGFGYSRYEDSYNLYEINESGKTISFKQIENGSDTIIHREYNWVGDKQIITETRFDGEYWEDTYYLGSDYHPFYGIHTSLLGIIGLEIADIIEPQNTFVLDKVDFQYYSIVFDYELNKNKFPDNATVFFNAPPESYQWKRYFKYEPY